MSKFANSSEAIDSSLILWSGIKPTNTSVKEIYDVLVFPATSVDNSDGGTTIFHIPSQVTGLMTDCEVITTFKVTKGDDSNLAANENVSVVNDIGNAMFSLVEVKVNSRATFLQQMTHSYSLCSFFETLLNEDGDRADILESRRLFVTDTGTKAQSDAPYFYPADAEHPVMNKGGETRAHRISRSKPVTVITKLNVPLFKQGKAILPDTEISVTLTKAKNAYCLQAAENSGHKLVINEIFLKCTYIKPQDILLNVMNSKLNEMPVTYEVDRQSVIARLLPQGSRTYTIHNVFDRGVLPKFVMFCVQDPNALVGQYNKNPHTFMSIRSLQFYVNNRQYFAEPLTNEYVPNGTWNDNCQSVMDNLYKSTHRDHHGSMLITRKNFNLYQFFTLCLSDDRTYGAHLGLKKSSDTRLEIDLGETTAENLILLAYCVYDQQVQIDGNKNVVVNE